MRRLWQTLLVMMLTGSIWAQEEVPLGIAARDDSLSLPSVTQKPTGIGLGATAFPEFQLHQPLVEGYSGLGLSYNLYKGTSSLGTYELNHKFDFQRYLPKDYLLRWDGGRMTGFNGIDFLPGIGGVATAGVTATHRFSDALTLTGGAMLQKTGILYNNASFHAMMTYQLSDYASVSAFGAYQTPSFMSMYHVQGRGMFGGYMTFHTEDKKWGIDLGEKTEVNPYTGRLEATPIVMPYYNLQGQKLGFDFGGLLKSVFMNMRMKKENNGQIGPMGPMEPFGPMNPRPPF